MNMEILDTLISFRNQVKEIEKQLAQIEWLYSKKIAEYMEEEDDSTEGET